MDRQQGGFFSNLPGFGGGYGQGQGPGGFPGFGPGGGGFPGQGPGGFPGGPGGFPGGPGGFPGQGPGGFPGQGPVGGGQGQTMQLPPPPTDVPQFGAQSFQGGPGVYAVDPGAFYGCLYRMTRVMLRNGQRFWFYPVFIGRRSVAGYRWRPRRRQWVYFGIDTDRIVTFQC
ncbi:hypothetical protein SAMN05421743_11610 [Thalassobacillus cyri]|uniref:Transporter n=1 Tax=Thalassobacillus cyri TaxID=571932 RepID=A0A1H4GH05_9BACI|nr:hypothetical protein [Thalassobacillus cyri]SEB08903.1 hypothetical protein SAMN05421743_11610 [Thalassobacillus cyri]